MKNFKNNQGITLVALIITIIVLLILAVVAISAVQGDGIIAHAKNARDDYGTAQEEENTILGNYLTELNNINEEKNNTTSVLFEYNTLHGYNEEDTEHLIYIYKVDNAVLAKAYIVENNDFDDLDNIKSVDDIKVTSKKTKYLKEIDRTEYIKSLQSKIKELSNQEDIEKYQFIIEHYTNSKMSSLSWAVFDTKAESENDIENYLSFDQVICITNDGKIDDGECEYSKLANQTEALRLIEILDLDTADLK